MRFFIGLMLYLGMVSLNQAMPITVELELDTVNNVAREDGRIIVQQQLTSEDLIYLPAGNPGFVQYYLEYYFKLENHVLPDTEEDDVDEMGGSGDDLGRGFDMNSNNYRRLFKFKIAEACALINGIRFRKRCGTIPGWTMRCLAWRYSSPVCARFNSKATASSRIF